MMRNLLVAIALLLAPLLTHADSGFTSRPLFDQSNVAITGGTISGVTLTGDVSGTAANVTGTVAADHGGTGVANNAAATLTRSGAHALTFTTVGTTGLTLPTTGTLAILDANTFTGVQTFSSQPILSSLTASLPVFSDGSKGLVSNAMTGTGNVVMSASPTLSGTIAGTYTLGGTPTLAAATWSGTQSAGGNQLNNVIIGTSTPLAGFFTTLSATGALTYGGVALTNAVTGTGKMVLDTAPIFYEEVTIRDTTGDGPNLLTLGAASTSFGSALRLRGYQNTNNNWQIGIGDIGSNFTITPSTAAGGITFTTPVLEITGAGVISANGNQLNNVIIGTVTPLAATFTTMTADNGIAVKATLLTNWSAVIAANTPSATFSKAATPLHIGGSTSGASYLSLIGFGYTSNANNYFPAYIGYISTSTTSNEKGALVFGTRDVTTDTIPTEQMRIGTDGAVTMQGTLTLPNQPSASGKRYLCINTAGLISSDSAACVGT